MMVRWLLGMKNNHSKSGTSTLRLLTTILHSDGDLTEQGKIRYINIFKATLQTFFRIIQEMKICHISEQNFLPYINESSNSSFQFQQNILLF